MIFSSARPLACVLAAATLLTALPAEAGSRWRDQHHRRPAPVERDIGGGALPAIGIPGLAAAAVIAGMVGQSRPPAWRHPQAWPRPSPDRNYFPPAPSRRSAPPGR